jgi:arylsulfatase A-like enzyme
VLDTLDATGQRENTLVMFISDMGAILRPTHGLGVASNAPFRDGAPALYEGGIRVPAIFRWPGRIQPGTECREMLSHLDLLPLFFAISDAKPAGGRVLDGRDPLPALAGEAKSPHERLVFTYSKSGAVREGSLKIIRSAANKPWELYDLASDPSETKNLATERPDDVQRLDAAYESFLADVKQDASKEAPVIK